MRRIRDLGLCLVTVLAFSAMVASAAQAGEAGECVKAAKVGKKYTGHYLDKNCQIVATPAEIAEGKRNKYEWVSPPTASFTAQSVSPGLHPVLEGGPAGKVQCNLVTVTGRWTGPKKDEEVATFTGCQLLNTSPTGECHSLGQASGVIVTNTLETTLLDSGERGPGGGTPAAGEVWDIFSAVGGSGVVAEYECAGAVVIRTQGTLGGVFAGVDVMSTVGHLAFTLHGPEQLLNNEVSFTGFGGPFFPDGFAEESVTVKIQYSRKVEIRAI